MSSIAYYEQFWIDSANIELKARVFELDDLASELGAHTKADKGM